MTRDDKQKPAMLEKRLRQLEREIERGTDTLLKVENDEVFKVANQRLEQLITQANAVRKKLHEAIDAPRTAAENVVDSAMDELRELAANVQHADTSIAREALKRYYESVTVWWTEKPPMSDEDVPRNRVCYTFSRSLLRLQEMCHELLNMTKSVHRLCWQAYDE